MDQTLEAGVIPEVDEEFRVKHEHLPEEIFVFGSNLRGMHGGGAARFALDRCGAIWGKPSGRQGWSYAIPTKLDFDKSLELKTVSQYVADFVEYARQHPQLDFFVTRIGCGLAGFTDEQIAPLFRGVPKNCRMPPEWSHWL